MWLWSQCDENYTIQRRRTTSRNDVDQSNARERFHPFSIGITTSTVRNNHQRVKNSKVVTWRRIYLLFVMMSYQVVEGFVYGAEPRWICMNSNSKPPFVATSACLYLCNGISFDSKSSTQRLNIIRWMLLVNYNDDDKEDDFSEDDEIVSPNVESPHAADMDENTVLGEIYDSGGVVLHDLSWRVEKLRLEEQNIQRFLKARPRFLPYNECRKWVQAFSRWQTEDDWNEWIAMGEKRNAYIPVSDD